MRTSLICVSIAVLMVIGMGCYEVFYTAEIKHDCIKFEDAMSEVEPDVWEEDCLGEDGAVEGDGFYAELDGDIVVPGDPEDGVSTVPIEVKVKAGKCRVTIVELVYSESAGGYMGEACGFTIYGFPVDPDYWEFAVVSDDIEGGKGEDTAALSNITFCFGDGITVIDPPEGDYETTRAEEEDIY